MKRLLALLLAVLLAAGMFTGCAEGHFRFDDDTSLTRGEWIAMLAQGFGLDSYVNAEPYYKDVAAFDPYFGYVQSCVEWDVLSEEESRLNMHRGATLEFVIVTAVKALGEDLTAYEGETLNEKALQCAAKRGIAPLGLKYGKRATYAQCQTVLEAAQAAYLFQDTEPINEVVLNEDVVDWSQNQNVTAVSDTGFEVEGEKPDVGQILVLPGTLENPSGVAAKVTNVIDNGDGTYSVETEIPEIYEVVEELEFADVVVPEISQIVPAEGVTLGTSGASNMSALLSESLSANTLRYTEGKDLRQLAGTKGDGLDFSLSFVWDSNNKLTISPGTNFFSAGVSLEPKGNEEKWKNAAFENPFMKKEYEQADQAIEDYKNGKIGVDELREKCAVVQNENGTERLPKYKTGYEIAVTVNIQDFYLTPNVKLKTAKVLGVDTGVPTGIERVTFESHFQTDISVGWKGVFEGEMPMFTTIIPIVGGLSVKAEAVLYCEANGELAVKVTMTNDTKVEYKADKWKKSASKATSVSLEGQASIEVGPKVSGTICFLSYEIIDVGVSAAVEVSASAGIGFTSTTTDIDDGDDGTIDKIVIEKKLALTYGIRAMAPVVKVSVGKKGTLAYKIGIKASFTIVGKEGKAIIAAPVWDIVPEKEIVFWKDVDEVLVEHEETVESESMSESGSEVSSLNGQDGMIDFAEYYIQLEIGAETVMELELPEGYKTKDFVWTSSNKNVATVKNGVVHAKEAGSTIIRAESKDGKHFAECAVYVGDVFSHGGSEA